MTEQLRLVERLIGEFAELAELAAADEVEPERLSAARREIDTALRGVELAAARARLAVLPPGIVPFPARPGMAGRGR